MATSAKEPMSVEPASFAWQAVGRALEGDHVAIAHRLHDVPTMRPDMRFDGRVVVAEEGHPLRVAELLVQGG